MVDISTHRSKPKGPERIDPTPKIYGYVAHQSDKVLLILKQGKRNTFIMMRQGDGAPSFEVGSVFFGKIYATRSDLSPDGKWFAYFAWGTKPYHHPNGKHVCPCWIAVSNPPSVTAQLFLPCVDTWGGGCMFLGDQLLIGAPMSPPFEITKSYKVGPYSVVFNPDQLKAKNKDLSSPYAWRDHPSKKGWLEKTRKDLALSALPKWLRDEIPSLSHMSKFGEFDALYYEVTTADRSELLLDQGSHYGWMDFDQAGRLLAARGAELHIYDGKASIQKGAP